MRVLHVIPSLDVADGGPATAIRGMTCALAEAGVDVSIATTHDRSDPDETAWAERGGVRIRSFERGSPRRWKYSPSLRRWLRANVPQVDVVHVHALFSYATIPACRAARRAAVPYVLRPLGTLTSWSLAHHAWKKRPYYTLIERAHLRDAAAIHATSETEAAAIAALGFGAKTYVIPHGVGSVQCSARPALSSNGASPLRVLFMSRLHPVKGLELLLEALAGLGSEGIHLTIAGDGEPGYVESLRRRASDLGLRDRVTFVGHVSGERKIKALAEAELFALPSYSENFGIAAAEAMAAGLPVIVSTSVGIASQIQAAEAGLVVSCDAGELRVALSRAAADRTTLRAWGDNASTLAARSFSWTASAERLITLYEKILV